MVDFPWLRIGFQDSARDFPPWQGAEQTRGASNEPMGDRSRRSTAEMASGGICAEKKPRQARDSPGRRCRALRAGGLWVARPSANAQPARGSGPPEKFFLFIFRALRPSTPGIRSAIN